MSADSDFDDVLRDGLFARIKREEKVSKNSDLWIPQPGDEILIQLRQKSLTSYNCHVISQNHKKRLTDVQDFSISFENERLPFSSFISRTGVVVEFKAILETEDGGASQVSASMKAQSVGTVTLNTRNGLTSIDGRFILDAVAIGMDFV